MLKRVVHARGVEEEEEGEWYAEAEVAEFDCQYELERGGERSGEGGYERGGEERYYREREYHHHRRELGDAYARRDEYAHAHAHVTRIRTRTRTRTERDERRRGGRRVHALEQPAEPEDEL